MQLIELDGAKSICSYGGTEKLDLETSLDPLKFSTDFDGSETVTISMTYDPHYKLLLTDTSGTVTEHKLSEDENGYVKAEIPAGTYTVKLCYENRIMDMAVISAIITLILTIIIIPVISRSSADRKK